MEWLHYVLLGVLPAIAAFAGGIVLKGARVVKEHTEDMQLVEDLMKALADKDNPITPDEFREKIEKLRIELGETQEAWRIFIDEIKKIVQFKK